MGHRGELAFIGLGLALGDLSLRALKFLETCDEVYLEAYTSIIPGFSRERLEELIGRSVRVVTRRDLEDKNGRVLLSPALEGKRVALLVIGDPFMATTHIELRIRAEKIGIRTRVFHAPSIFTAVIGATGLQPYKFGKTVTIVYPDEKYGYFPLTPYEVLRDNITRGLHTLFLLDLKVEEGRAMTINEALTLLLEMEAREKLDLISPNTLVVGLARISSENSISKAAIIQELLDKDFGPPPHTLVVPGQLHPLEEEALIVLCGASREVVASWNEKLRRKLRNISRT